MMTSDYIKNVSEADFEYEVLAYSQQIPVVVDFWAEWCGPCKMLGPVLERLANEAQGSFRLAKVNVDENQNLALRYGIHSIPAVKAFKDGKMVAEFAGVQPEPRVREFIRNLAPSPADLALEKGFSLLGMQQARPAELAFRQALQAAPESSSAQLGLAKSLLLLGRISEGLSIINNFPPSREYNTAQTLLHLAKALAHVENGGVYEGVSELDPAFENAMRLALRGNFEAAMDGLLDILREDKRYRNGLARQTMVALLDLLGDENPITRQYRNELATVLF